MPRTKIPYDEYKVKAFLDTNIILEGRPLTELPWEEIDADGPIIALMTPTAIKEVDSKKQDGRIGKRAREFNKYIAPVAAGGPPIVIRESGPRVELALSYAVRIPWDQHDDLDPDDGDSCIVAETIHAKDMTDAGKLLISQDIKPIALAANYDLQTKHVPEKWLRSMEPGPADKEVQRLKGKLAEYEAKEPAFEIQIEMLDEEPVPVVRLEDLTGAERDGIERKIKADNPQLDQSRGIYDVTSALTFDHSYSDRYQKYRRNVSIYMDTYAQRLERLFNQARVQFTVLNTGKLQAENVVVTASVSGGWLHDRYVWASPAGPTPPKPRDNPLLHSITPLSAMLRPQPGRHEWTFKEEPAWGPSFSMTCIDFRHEEKWMLEAIVGLDPRAADTIIMLSVTAGNFRGKAGATKRIERDVGRVHVSSVIDLASLKIIRTSPLQEMLQRGGGEDKIDFSAFALRDESDDD